MRQKNQADRQARPTPGGQALRRDIKSSAMRNLDIATKTQEQISEELDVTLLESVRCVKSALKAGAELGDIRGAAALLAQEIGASLTDMPEDELEEELDAGSSRQQEVGRIPEAAR